MKKEDTSYIVLTHGRKKIFSSYIVLTHEERRYSQVTLY